MPTLVTKKLIRKNDRDVFKSPILNNFVFYPTKRTQYLFKILLDEVCIIKINPAKI